MIVVDSSVWIDHFRQPVTQLSTLIRMGQVAMHPYVVGELAIGNFPDWPKAIGFLRSIPGPNPVSDDGFYDFIRKHRLMGTGIGFVDIHLLAAAMAEKNAKIWCRDKRLQAQAEWLGCSFIPT